jgi:aspartate kinase
VQDELARGRVVIVAGYQGVSYKREVTTLGRGGSDTTAVALAAALDAEACEIYSDVAGVFTADPRVVPEARRLTEISYEEMQELAEAGARVLNAQAVEFAKERGIAIYARATAGGDGETVVRRHAPRAPGRVVGVASETGLVLLCVSAGDLGPLVTLLEGLDSRAAGGKQLRFDGPLGASLVLSRENLHDFDALRALIQSHHPGVSVLEGVGAVSAIGAGINASFHNVRVAVRLASEPGTQILGLATSSFRISLLLAEAEVPDAVRRLHRGLVDPSPGASPLSPADPG